MKRKSGQRVTARQRSERDLLRLLKSIETMHRLARIARAGNGRAALNAIRRLIKMDAEEAASEENSGGITAQRNRPMAKTRESRARARPSNRLAQQAERPVIEGRSIPLPRSVAPLAEPEPEPPPEPIFRPRRQ